MDSDQWLIDFIIPAYNAEGTITRTLDSLRAQTDPHWNAIVVDDGSTDQTSRIVNSYDDERIRRVFQPNRGPGAARNLGFRLSGAQTVCFLDADDTVSEDFVARMVPPALRSVIGASCGYSYVDSHKNTLYQVPPVDEERLTSSAVLLLDPPAIMSLVYRRDTLAVIEDDGMVFDETLRAYEDWEMLQRLMKSTPSNEDGCFAKIDKGLANYWCEPGSLSSDLSSVWHSGSCLMKTALDPDELEKAYSRSWAVGVFAGCIVTSDHQTSQLIRAAIGALCVDDVPGFVNSIRWHTMRRFAIATSEIDSQHDQTMILIREHVQGDELLSHIEACLSGYTMERAEQIVMEASRSVGSDGRLVIYGLGRNAAQLLTAVSRLDVEHVITDDMPARYADDPRRIGPGSITSSDVVIVTPTIAQRLLDKLGEAEPARIIEYQGMLAPISR